MFKNYLKIAYRNLFRNKLYSVINVLGLAIGIASCLLIMIYVQDETSYDNFHSKGDRIYRIGWEQQRQNGLVKYSLLPYPAKEVMLDNIPEIEKITRLYTNNKVGGPVNLRYQDKSFNEDRLYFADPNIFEVFDFEFLLGNSETALSNANSIILTESSAKKYFGDKNPIGEEIRYDNFQTIVVRGVIKDIPSNSHILFDFLVPLENLRNNWVKYSNYDFEIDWKWSGSWTYALLKEQADVKSMRSKLPQLVDGKFLIENKDEYSLIVQPLQSIYLHSDLAGEPRQMGNANQLYLLSVVAFIILLIGVINFMNLSTARSIKRAREVGIRKVMGAVKRTLIYQFLGEAMLISIIALCHAFLLLSLTLHTFNVFTGKSYVFSEVVFDPLIIFGSLIVAVLTGLLAGSYPAFYLSSFKPVKTLKNDFKSSGSLPLRKILVIIQFAITVVFIFSILIVNNQLNFLRGKDLGYSKDLVMVVENRNRVGQNFDVFVDNVKKNNAVKSVYRGMIPGISSWSNTVIPEGKTEGISTRLLYTGYDLTQLFEMNIVAGRGFDRFLDLDSVLDNSSFLINQAAAKSFGWESGALGKELRWVGGNDNKTLIKGDIVGVVEDFHYQSLYREIKPLVIKLSDWGNIAIKIGGQNMQETINFIENEYHALAPEWEFKYSFLDDDLYKSYQKEERLSDLIRYFAGLAIFISCSGFFGLIAFMNEQRKKEIAIRKTLGATIRNLVVLLSKDFITLVLIASIIGCPVGYYIMEEWLSGFAYRVKVDPLVFLGATLISIIIAFFTLSYQSIKVANDNPINALRNE